MGTHPAVRLWQKMTNERDDFTKRDGAIGTVDELLTFLIHVRQDD